MELKANNVNRVQPPLSPAALQALIAGQQRAPGGNQLAPNQAGVPQNDGQPSVFDKTLSQLSSEELNTLGAGSTLSELAGLQGDLTVGEVAPLLRNPVALDSIIDLMGQRSDLKVSDFLTKDLDGRVMVDPSYKSGETMDFLKERPDISPQDVTKMRESFSRLFRDPMMGKWATEMGFDLMRQRPDLGPEDMTKMMDEFGRAAGMGDKSQGSNMPGSGAAGATLDMFESASRLLVKRPDMKPERLGQLAQSVGRLGSPDDPSRGQRVAEGFDAAVTSLETNPLRQPEELASLATVIGKHFKGKDENSAAIRMNAFSQSAKMMGENPDINAESIDSLLNSAKSSNPKNNQPRALGNALNGVFEGVNQGLVPSSNLNSQFKGSPTPAKGKNAQPGDKQNPEDGQNTGNPAGQQPGSNALGQTQGQAQAQAPGQVGPSKRP